MDKLPHMNEKTDYLLQVLGSRLKRARLNINLTQQQVADLISKSRTAIEGAEKGKCTLGTFVSILVALKKDDQLDLFLPESPPSPVQLAKISGNKRRRASSTRKSNLVESNKTSLDEDELEW